MNFSHLLMCLFVALSLPTPASSSKNGLLYKCDADKLKAEDMCYFVPTGSDTMSPHKIDRSVAADGFRQVSDASGSPLRVTPKPWTQGDKLTKSADVLADDLIGYANIFELVAPLRDAMMYDPKTLSADAAAWGKLTKSLVDCKIKEKDTTMEKGGKTMTVYSVAGVYALLKKANGVDTHHPILQFLEEGAIELVCLAVPSLKSDHCDKIRKANAVTTEPSTCWHQAYKGMYGSLPRTKGTGNSDPASTTAASETTVASGSTTAASETTADPASTTAASETTVASGSTTAGSETTAASASTTAGSETTAAGVTSAGPARGMAPGVACLSLCVGALLARWLR